jgi:electron transfer flavoprotein alpha subunit
MPIVLILAEQAGGAVRKASLHALAAGRELARRASAELHAAVVGAGIRTVAEEVARAGVPVHAVDDPALLHPIAAVRGPALAALARRLGAAWVGAASTAEARDILPRTAARLEAAMASDVLGFGGDGPAVTYRRPMWAGNVVAEVELATAVQVFSVRTTEFPSATLDAPAGPVLEEPVEALPDPRTEHLAFDEAQSARPALTEAKVVISGGRGTKGDFRPIEELADALGGAVGASRAAVDAGWVPNDWQVGQTGKVVAPELYVAAGISGAVQHLAGMKGARVIVAVNKDPEAPIFQVADYGLVADLFEALPALSARVKGSR